MRWEVYLSLILVRATCVGRFLAPTEQIWIIKPHHYGPLKVDNNPLIFSQVCSKTPCSFLPACDIHKHALGYTCIENVNLKLGASFYRYLFFSVCIFLFIIDSLVLSACRKVFPTLYEAAPPGPQREPPSSPRRQNAVRTLPQRRRPLSRAGAAVLEDGVHTRQSGCRQGNVDVCN